MIPSRYAPVNVRNTRRTTKRFVQLRLVLQLRMARARLLKLDRHFPTRLHAHAQINVAERTTPNLTTETVPFSYSQIH